jgi:hypothetical protein
VDKDTIWEAHGTDEPADLPEEESPLTPVDDQERRTMLCRSCHLPRVFRRRRIRHSLHFVFAIGTLGLWLPVWGLLIILQHFKPWACTVCGVHRRND